MAAGIDHGYRVALAPPARMRRAAGDDRLRRARVEALGRGLRLWRHRHRKKGRHDRLKDHLHDPLAPAHRSRR
jgi:hypothetical protein